MEEFNRFDAKSLFVNSLTDGLTIFCGAGFSVLAKDENENNLPVGDQLLTELKDQFSSISSYSSLPKACTKIIRSDKAAFYSYLKSRFSVIDFDPLYLSLLDINIKSIYTTNIDDLWHKIYEKSSNSFQLYDRGKGQEINYELKVDYFPLHGCVRNQGDFVFGTTEIASAFSKEGMQQSWKSLARDASENAILFWGWNFEDSGPIEAMYGKNSKFDSNVQKWVLLYNPDEETIDYLDSLGFNIIIGDTKVLLNFISSIRCDVRDEYDNKIDDSVKKQLKKYCVPENDDKLPSYSINCFFSEFTPHWSHIYSDKIPKLRHYKTIMDLISTNANIMVIGIRCSGKTTLMMQLILHLKTAKLKHFMIAPSVEQVDSYIKIIGDKSAILFVDDCFRDTNAVCKLLSRKNIQVVLFDRDFNYERQYHKITTYDFEKVDITEIKAEDAQNIINSIPEELKHSSDVMQKFKKDPTIVNLLANILKKNNFRFLKIFHEQDNEAADVFLMVCYVHSCGVPCSFDMIYSFLGDDNYHWTDMYGIIERAGNLIKELNEMDPSYELIDYIQDYYLCRSRYLAEKIISSISNGNKQFKDVLERFTRYVPQYKICQYDKFRRSAYDAGLVSKAYDNYQEGEEFYRLCAEKDNSEYIFQQAALYFADHKQYKQAFDWIDKARSLAHYNRFSIDSTYAQIYFDVNVNASVSKMEEALDILRSCCKDDKRNTIHFVAFANRVLVYCDNSDNNDKKIKYLFDAMSFINEGLSENNKASSQKKKWELKKIKELVSKQIDFLS